MNAETAVEILNGIIGQLVSQKEQYNNDEYHPIERCKKIFERNQNGETYREIAESMNISTARVYSLGKKWEGHVAWNRFIDSKIEAIGMAILSLGGQIK